MVPGRAIRLEIQILLFAGLVSMAGPGRAESALSTVVMLRPAMGDAVSTELITRLKGELSTDRFQVVVLDHVDGADPFDELLRVARLFRPVALFAVFVQPGGGADVWLLDRDLGVPRMQHIEVPRPGPDSPSLLALRAIEVLRANVLAGLLDRRSVAVETATRQSHAYPEMAPAAVEVARPSAPRLGLELGPAILGSFQRMGIAFVPVLKVGYVLKDGLAIRAAVSALGTRPTLDGPAGQATVDQELGLLEIAWRMRGWSKGGAHVVAGIGTYRLGVQGVATAAAAQPIHNQLWTGACEAGVGANAFVSRSIAVGFEVDALLTFPYPMVRIGTYDAGRTGRPAMLAAMSVQFWL